MHHQTLFISSLVLIEVKNMAINIKIGGGAASVPNATTTTEGKVRLATIAEATTGTSESISVTPAGLSASIAGITGGLEYKGLYDASLGVPDLSNAEKGDFYKVSAAGTIYGRDWDVNDNLLVNEDMGGTINNAKIDKIDNTEAVSELDDLSDVSLSSEASGEVLKYDGSSWINAVLSSSDVSGVATATDLTALDARITTNEGDISSIDGRVTTAEGNIVSLGSQISSNDSDISALDARVTTNEGDITSLTSQVSSNDSDISALDARVTTNEGDISTLTSSSVTSVNNITPVSGNVTLTASNITGLSTVATTGAYSDLSGTPTLATVATTGAYTDLSGTPTLGTAAALDVGTSANNVVQLNGSAQLPAIDGSNLTGITTDVSSASVGDLSDVTITSAASGDALIYNGTAWVDTALATVATTGAYSDLSGTPTLGTAAALDVGTSANNVVQLNGSAQLPAIDGSNLTGITADVSSASVGDLSDVTITSATSGDALIYNGSAWVDTALATVATSGAASDLTGLATVATSGAASDLTGLATVATSGAYSDLTGTPTLGTAAALDVGTSANNVVQLDGSGALPAVDGSALTGLTVDLSTGSLSDLGDVTITSAASGDALVYNGTAWVDTALATVATTGDFTDLINAPTSTISGASFVTDTNALTLVAGTHYIISTATSSTKTLTLPSVSSDGDYIRITNWGLGDLVVQVDQSSTDAYLLVGQSITQNGSVTIESKATVDLFGFSYTQGGITYDPAWGVYFSSSIELNTKSFSTTGQLAYYDATNQELTAGDLGDLTFSFSPSNYDNTRGGTVTGTGVSDHFGGVDDALGLKANSADLALVATDGDLPALTDVTITSAASGDALVYNGTAWVNDSVAYSDLTGTPTLGTAAALNVGTSANNVVQLDGSGALPAVDGSALTNVTSSPSAPDVTTNSPGSTYTISTSNGAEEVYLLTPSVNCTVTLPTASTAGSGYRYYIKNLSTNTLTLNTTIDGTSGFDLSVQYSAVTIVSDGSAWYII